MSAKSTEDIISESYDRVLLTDYAHRVSLEMMPRVNSIKAKEIVEQIQSRLKQLSNEILTQVEKI